MACESIWRSKGSESQGMFCLRRTGWNVSCSLATILPLRATNLRDFERPPVVSHLVLETMDSRMHDFGGWGGGELYDVETRLTGGDRIPGGSIPMHELEWSHAEKTVARRAFDKALGKELEALIREAKSRAARIEEPPDLWNLENWLTERRREIEGTTTGTPLFHSFSPTCFVTVV